MQKTCTKCGEEKPISEFSKDKSNKADGYNRQCKKCVNAYKKSLMTPEKILEKNRRSRAYKARNVEKIREASLVYREKNRETILEKNRIYSEKNREQINQKSKERYQRDREKILAYFDSRKDLKKEYDHVYREKNKDRIKDRASQYKRENPDKVRKLAHKRRAIARNSGGVYSVSDLERIKIGQRMRCANCKTCLKKSGYHVDHVHPLALGGTNRPDNLQLLCPSCNLSKGAKDPIEWAQVNGRLL